MLNETQVNGLWEDMLADQVRSLYFADLGARYARYKQIITGVSLFLAAGAAATIAAHSPLWIPGLCSTVTAVLTAYSMAVGLDRKAVTMAKLHYTWGLIESERRRLWSHWSEDDAENRLREIEIRAQDASQIAVSDAPIRQDLLEKWRISVYKQHGATA